MGNKIIEWMIQSSWFHKYNSIIGAFCAGLWFQAHYWKQINLTLSIWGFQIEEYMSSLLLIVAASGISVSVFGTVLKNKKIAENKRKSDINT